MKKIALYQCERCGLSHAYEQACVQCENSHFGVGSIEDIIYYQGSKYPSRILVKNPDETYRIYQVQEPMLDKTPQEEWASMVRRNK
jgi:hypothetical protein